MPKKWQSFGRVFYSTGREQASLKLSKDFSSWDKVIALDCLFDLSRDLEFEILKLRREIYGPTDLPEEDEGDEDDVD